MAADELNLLDNQNHMHAFFTDEWKAESLRLQKERDALKADLAAYEIQMRHQLGRAEEAVWWWRFGALSAIAIAVYVIVVHLTQGVCN